MKPKVLINLVGLVVCAVLILALVHQFSGSKPASPPPTPAPGVSVVDDQYLSASLPNGWARANEASASAWTFQGDQQHAVNISLSRTADPTTPPFQDTPSPGLSTVDVPTSTPTPTPTPAPGTAIILDGIPARLVHQPSSDLLNPSETYTITTDLSGFTYTLTISQPGTSSDKLVKAAADALIDSWKWK